jgi:hypothetical protein
VPSWIGPPRQERPPLTGQLLPGGQHSAEQLISRPLLEGRPSAEPWKSLPRPPKRPLGVHCRTALLRPRSRPHIVRAWIDQCLQRGRFATNPLRSDRHRTRGRLVAACQIDVHRRRTCSSDRQWIPHVAARFSQSVPLTGLASLQEAVPPAWSHGRIRARLSVCARG